MISINNVSFKYLATKQNAIEGLNLTIKKGEFVVLAGSSGCGKTTVTRLINRLAPLFYDGELSGEIAINGGDVNGLEIDEMAGVVGSVFQDPRSQFFATDTLSEIAFSCENLNFATEKINRRVEQVIKQLKIEHLIGKSIFTLSSGEKQAVAIASVCTLKPIIMVLDEPSANLDMQATKDLAQMLATLKQNGVTIIISEHRLAYLKDLADRVLVMENGIISHEFSHKKFNTLSNNRLNSLGLRCTDMASIKPSSNLKTSDKVAVEACNISFGYNKKTTLLHNVNLRINKGSIVGVIGRNGAGKSTLLEIICGLRKPSGGELYFNGHKTTAKERIAKSYYVMQNSDCQLFSESVEKELFLGKTISETDGKKASDTLKSLDLYHLLKRHPASLSGGQKQRLSIALAQTKLTDIIVMDEPTSGLDYNSMMQVTGYITNMAQQGGTILLVSHDYEFLMSSCNIICYLDDGCIAQCFELNDNSCQRLYKLLNQ